MNPSGFWRAVSSSDGRGSVVLGWMFLILGWLAFEISAAEMDAQSGAAWGRSVLEDAAQRVAILTICLGVFSAAVVVPARQESAGAGGGIRNRLRAMFSGYIWVLAASLWAAPGVVVMYILGGVTEGEIGWFSFRLTLVLAAGGSLATLLRVLGLPAGRSALVATGALAVAGLSAAGGWSRVLAGDSLSTAILEAGPGIGRLLYGPQTAHEFVGWLLVIVVCAGAVSQLCGDGHPGRSGRL